MFMKILVPLDRGDKHRPALQIAAELARQSKGEITLLHVIEVIPGLSMDEERTFYDRLDRSARKHLERLGAALTEQQISWQVKVIFGTRALEIARYAGENGSDLMVLSSPAPDPANPAAGWGSLSFKMSLLSPCPVLLVK
jgi:nucleotide-binding universal stress UspA family protein